MVHAINGVSESLRSAEGVVRESPRPLDVAANAPDSFALVTPKIGLGMIPAVIHSVFALLPETDDIKIKAEADKLFTQGDELRRNRSYVEAASLFEQAAELYFQAKNYIKEAEARRWASDCVLSNNSDIPLRIEALAKEITATKRAIDSIKGNEKDDIIKKIELWQALGNAQLFPYDPSNNKDGVNSFDAAFDLALKAKDFARAADNRRYKGLALQQAKKSYDDTVVLDAFRECAELNLYKVGNQLAAGSIQHERGKLFGLKRPREAFNALLSSYNILKQDNPDNLPAKERKIDIANYRYITAFGLAAFMKDFDSPEPAKKAEAVADDYAKNGNFISAITTLMSASELYEAYSNDADAKRVLEKAADIDAKYQLEYIHTIFNDVETYYLKPETKKYLDALVQLEEGLKWLEAVRQRQSKNTLNEAGYQIIRNIFEAKKADVMAKMNAQWER